LRLVERVTIDVVVGEVVDIEVLSVRLQPPDAGWSPSDIDGDGIPNEEDADRDGDGLANDEESLVGTDPDNPDTDYGGIPDGFEVSEGLDPLEPADDWLSAGGLGGNCLLC
jgi:hypothetical protein